jgi:hypothetical protein
MFIGADCPLHIADDRTYVHFRPNDGSSQGICDNSVQDTRRLSLGQRYKRKEKDQSCHSFVHRLPYLFLQQDHRDVFLLRGVVEGFEVAVDDRVPLFNLCVDLWGELVVDVV